MAVLAGYFDDSGTHKGSGVVVVGGAIASVPQWIKLSRKWQRTIEPWKLKRGHFHMTDFVGGFGDYEGWTESIKAKRLMQLVRIIHGGVRVLIGNAVLENDFAEAIRKFPNRNIETAYRFCAFLILPAVDRWRKRSPQREPIALMFEKGNKLMNEFGRTLGEVGQSDHLSEKFGYSSITQGTKVDMPPLQAADLIAYATYKSFMQGTMESYLETAFELLFTIEHEGQLFGRELIEKALPQLVL